jgi:hypothetical protein
MVTNRCLQSTIRNENSSLRLSDIYRIDCRICWFMDLQRSFRPCTDAIYLWICIVSIIFSVNSIRDFFSLEFFLTNLSSEIYQLLSLKHRSSGFMQYIYIIFYLVTFFRCFSLFVLFSVHLDVQIMSFSFIGLVICTYLSWSNYYLAQKCDPGYISTNREQQNRVNDLNCSRKKNFLIYFFKDYYSVN